MNDMYGLNIQSLPTGNGHMPLGTGTPLVRVDQRSYALDISHSQVETSLMPLYGQDGDVGMAWAAGCGDEGSSGSRVVPRPLPWLGAELW